MDLKKRFYIGKGRYQSMNFSRYKTNTYGLTPIPNLQIDFDKGAHGTYGGLLFDKRWIARRAEILKRDQFQCIICFVKDNLQVHHRQYHFIKELQQFKSPWDYEDYLLITLCGRCHSKGHGKFKVPTIYL